MLLLWNMNVIAISFITAATRSVFVSENEESDPQEERRQSWKADESVVAEIFKRVQQLTGPEITAEDLPLGDAGAVHHGERSKTFVT